MNLKKSLRIMIKVKSKNGHPKERGQSAIEYILLVAIAIIALLGANFVINTKDNAFEDHFYKVNAHITGRMGF